MAKKSNIFCGWPLSAQNPKKSIQIEQNDILGLKGLHFQLLIPKIMLKFCRFLGSFLKPKIAFFDTFENIINDPYHFLFSF